VLAYHPGYTESVDQMAAFVNATRSTLGTRNVMARIGGGDHGGGPDAAAIASLREKWGRAAGTVRFGRFDEFVEAVRGEGKNLPVFRGELDFRYEGGYTTCGELKDRNRVCEVLLVTAEKLSALGWPREEYPVSAFEAGWRRLLMNQFHDTIAGCVIPPAYEDAMGLYQQIEESLRPLLDRSLRALAARIDTAALSRPVLVFNPLSFPRTGLVTVPLSLQEARLEWVAVGPNGAREPTQKTRRTGTRGGSLIFLARAVPSLGYRAYDLVEGQAAASPTVAEGDAKIETVDYRVEFDTATGDLAQLLDRRSGFEVLAPGERGNAVQVLEDKGDSEGELQLTGKQWPLESAVEARIVERGPVRFTYRTRNKLRAAHTTFTRETALVPGLPWIEFTTEIEWNSQEKMVKASFPLTVSAGSASYEIPYGVIDRPSEGRERPALRWVDVSDGSRGVALLNANRYGYDVQGSTVRLSLLRSPITPAHNDDSGNHAVRYALLPHQGGFREAKLAQLGPAFNEPLLVHRPEPRVGKLAREFSFLELGGDHVVLGALKKAEDSAALVARIVESHGEKGAVSLRVAWPLHKVEEADLLERPTGEIRVEGNLVRFPINPWEIKTLILR